MISFTQRSGQKELLDNPAIPFEDIKRNMQELNTINTLLGGHKITQKGFDILMKRISPNTIIDVVEIGCGGGDNLRAIQTFAGKKKLNIKLTGVDIYPECIAYAQQQSANKDITFICSDYKKVIFPQPPHIIFSSLFCHHFTNDELVEMLQWQYQNSTIGFFINDLHRHPLAYYSIKLLTQLFSKSYLVKNDAPVSVRRSFIKKDWEKLLQGANINNYNIRWQWAFRWLITVIK